MPDFSGDPYDRIARLEADVAELRRRLDLLPERLQQLGSTTDWEWGVLLTELTDSGSATAHLRWQWTDGSWHETADIITVWPGKDFLEYGDVICVGTAIRVRYQPPKPGRKLGRWYVVGVACPPDE